MNYTDPVRSSQASLIPIPVTPAPLPKIRILIGAVVAIGPGKADLLAAIERCALGSAGAQAALQAHRAGPARQVVLPFARNRRRRHEALASPKSRTGVRRYPPRDPLRSQ